jgi:replication-associated recombination protein RarA
MDITPTRLEEFVFEDDATLEVLRNVVSNDNLLPATRVGVLLYGGYGTGKTTLARLLPNLIERTRTGISDVEAMSDFVECASVNGQDAIKRIQHQSRFVALSHTRIHFFIFDEFDVLTEKAQANFKSIMTNTPDCVFVITTNHLHAVDQGVQDRCWCISLNAASNDRWLPAARQILEKLGVTDTKDDALLELLSASSTKSAREVVSSLQLMAALRSQKAA